MHRLKNWQLFAICVLTWGTTWYAITFQLGHTTPEVGMALRFALAGSVILAICVYHAERHIVSGLVAVGYSACASRDAS